jgi:N-acetylmuramoyl-L-alanine amidase
VEKYRGLQVYYSENHEKSLSLAQTIQTVSEEILHNTNGRKVKSAGDSIYLMKNLEIPAILVECGFLSNSEETVLLKSERYQKKLALCLYASLIRYFSENV